MATKKKANCSDARGRRKLPQNMTIEELTKRAKLLYKEFNDHPKRFEILNVKGEAEKLDISGYWPALERKLKEAGKTEDEIKEYHQLNAYFATLIFDIGKTNKHIDFKKAGKIKRNNPVYIDQKDWILSEAAKFRRVEDIFEELIKSKGYNTTIKTFKAFIVEHKKEIEKRRKTGKDDITKSGPISDGYILHFYTESFEYYYKQWQRSRKTADLNMCLKIAGQIKNHLQTNELKITIDGKIDINHSIEVKKSLNQRFGELSTNMLTIGLAAAQVNINPLQIMAQLAKSRYAQWTGYTSAPLSLSDKDKMQYNSAFIKNYNWAEIEEKNRNEQGPQTIEDAIIIKDENELSEAITKRQKLLDILSQKNKEQEA